MDAKRILRSGLAGTTVMTLFSYIVSEASRQNYKEPELLGAFLERIMPTVKKEVAKITGWTAHYTIGIIFAVIFAAVLRHRNLKSNAKEGVVLGAISGLFGVAMWKSIFKVHPNPPKIPLKGFFSQLVIAHVVYGVVAALVYKLHDKEAAAKELRSEEDYPIEFLDADNTLNFLRFR